MAPGPGLDLLRRLAGLFRIIGSRRGGGSGLPEPPPVVIGATGGSGTRAVHRVLGDAGLFMGARLNGAGDAMDFEPFLDDMINPILERTRSLAYRPEDLGRDLSRPALDGLALVATRYAADRPAPDAPWGWKNPRSMYILPLIHAVFPRMRFVHLLRDGRDMALSDNQNQLRKHGGALFGGPPPEPGPAASIRLWAEANAAVADWAERTLGDRYVRLRFEDLCAAPERGVTDLLDRLGIRPALPPDRVAAPVAAPPSLGRWRDATPETIAAMEAEAGATLDRFGYR